MRRLSDIEMISEIVLVAEEFIGARLLARKFITLYALCRELLSKQVMVSLGFCVTYVLINTCFIPTAAGRCIIIMILYMHVLPLILKTL